MSSDCVRWIGVRKISRGLKQKKYVLAIHMHVIHDMYILITNACMYV